MSEQERAFGLQAGVVLVDHVVSAESVADDNAKALSLFAEATPITSLTMCLRSLAGRPRSFEQLATDYAAVFS
jgi:hypothetical protein